MTTPANAEFFAQPHWRVIAAGFDTERWFNDGQAVGTGGIFNPQPVRLPTGHYLYRFASSRAPASTRLGGGWWLDFESFNRIRQFASRHAYSVRQAARLMLALPYDWTRADLLVRALPMHDLQAYAGLGKPARGSDIGPDRGTTWIPTVGLQVRQLYVPGLFVPGRDTQLYESVFAPAAEFTSLR